MGAEVERIDGDGGPHERECRHAIARLRQHGGAVLQRLDVGAVAPIFGRNGLVEVRLGLEPERDKARIVAHP